MVAAEEATKAELDHRSMRRERVIYDRGGSNCRGMLEMREILLAKGRTMDNGSRLAVD